MLNELKEQSNVTLTENGALAWKSTHSECLNFFASAGALRRADFDVIRKLFIRAFIENPNDAMKILFYLRDVRGGLGERNVFRKLIRYTALHRPNTMAKAYEIYPYVRTFRRYFCFDGYSL